MLEQLILGLFSVSIWSEADSFLEFGRRFGANGKRLFDTILSPTNAVRDQFITIVVDKTRPSQDVIKMMRDNHLLNELRHVRPEALGLLSLSTQTPNPRLFAELLFVALKLKDYRNLKSRVDTMLKSLMTSSEAKTPIRREVVAAVEAKTALELDDVSLEDLTTCINNAVTALSLLAGSELSSQRAKLFDMLCMYLHDQKPVSWVGLFKGAHTIAIFIKYMTREDFGKAYAAFENFNSQNAEFMDTLVAVRQIYTSPVVTPEEVDQIMRDGTSPEAVEGLLGGIAARAQCLPSDSQFIVSTSVDWMRYMYTKINIPMAPRNAQIITMLTAVTWMRRVLERGDGTRALIGQVGTGEGKSLIIALTSIYLVKVRKRRHPTSQPASVKRL